MSGFSFTVDSAHAKEHNEFLKDQRRLQVSAIVFGVVQVLVAGVFIWYTNQAAWAWLLAAGLGVSALVSFSMVVIIPKKVGSAQHMYDSYELVPAVIAKVNPRDMVLLALVDARVDRTEGNPAPALAARTITNLSGHSRQEGERVPAVAVAGRRNLKHTGYWDEISPMPIAWGTPNPETIKQARNAIPQQQWEQLRKHAGRIDEVLATPLNLLKLT